MIISNQVQNLLKVYGKQLKSEPIQPKKEVSSVKKAADEVKISGEGKLFQRAILAAKQAPDLNADRIAGLKQSVAQGDYSADNQDVAESMLRQILEEKLV